MGTEGVNGQNAPKPVYDEKFLKGAKPKDEATRSLFNQLWDEAGNMLEEADANGDGKIDKDDLPFLNQLIKNLQAGQKFISKNIGKFSFDAQQYRRGFQMCETNIKKVIDEITSGTYVSRKEQAEKLAEQRRAEQAEKQKAEQAQAKPADLEPTENDADVERFNKPYYRDLARRGNNRLKALAKEKQTLEAEESWYNKHGQPYYGRTSREAGQNAMSEIIQEFLPRTQQGKYMLPDKDDADFLMLWAEQQFYDGTITASEKEILVKAAKNALAVINEKANQAQNNQDNEMTELSDNRPTADDIINQIHAETPVGGNYGGNSAAADAAVAQVHNDTPVRKRR